MLEILIAISILIFFGVAALIMRLYFFERGLDGKIDNAEKFQDRIERVVKDEISRNRDETSQRALESRGEIIAALEKMRETVHERLKSIQAENSEKLEKMRETVDEKLHNTLEKRLGESFNQVRRQLESVHKGLGEMQNLASSVGDLKKVLTNVKTRGTWGEIQLGALLEQILISGQYEQNVATKAGSNERVEFAIKLPGKDRDEASPMWLPIDAKFPQEDYQRLLEAQDQAQPQVVDKMRKQLEIRIKAEAKDIKEKYIDPPQTTCFGIMFLPIEGLYAEVLRIPGLADTLQRDYQVTIAGPTTLAALLNSLQMGFRTLAIEKRSSQVWQLLGAVKTEFAKFGMILERTKKKLQEATNTIDSASTKTRTIERRLRKVEELPDQGKDSLLESELSREDNEDE
jgi:DNA recombination protein RmuC